MTDPSPGAAVPRALLVVAPAAARRALEPLLAAHAARRPVELREAPAPAALRGAAAVLVVGPRGRSPRTALPGLFLRDADGRPVPAGWVPEAGEETLARFAAAAAAAQGRAALPRGPVALLGQWDARALRMADRAEGALRAAPAEGEDPPPLVRWTAERLTRRDLLGALGLGLGAALYLGHGRPVGWAGYHGLHLRHLRFAQGAPAGAVLSLACNVAGRHGTAQSFCEALVLGGLAAAAVGAVRPTLHLLNGQWAMDLCQALRGGEARTLADLLLAARALRRPDRGTARRERLYRILGDPLAPLCGAAGAAEAARAVSAPAPDAPLPDDRDEAGRQAS